MVSAVDEALRSVTYALRRYGFYQNSVGVFSTDSGGQPLSGVQQLPAEGPQGHLYWEGGVRVRGFFHIPLLRRRRRVSAALGPVSDWYPTLLRLAGGNARPPDGRTASTCGRPSARAGRRRSGSSCTTLTRCPAPRGGGAPCGGGLRHLGHGCPGVHPPRGLEAAPRGPRLRGPEPAARAPPAAGGGRSATRSASTGRSGSPTWSSCCWPGWPTDGQRPSSDHFVAFVLRLREMQ